MTRLLTFITFLSIMCQLSARDFTARPVPPGAPLFGIDSLTVTSSPAMKVSFSYLMQQNTCSVTLLSDTLRRPLLAIESITGPAFTHVDTVLLSPDGLIMRRAVLSMRNGVQEKLDVYVTKKPDTHWKHTPQSSSGINLHLAGLSPDANGNWTKAHSCFPGVGIDPEPCLTRDIVYSLDDGDAALTARYAAMRDSLSDPAPETGNLIGFILLAIAVLIATYSLKSPDIDNRRRRFLAGPLTFVPACFGLYFTWQFVYFSWGTVWAVALCVAFVAAAAFYLRTTIVTLEDDRSLSNGYTTPPLIITAITLVLVGWIIGAEMWGTWWAAALSAACFSIPLFSKPDRGERCARCHRMGAMQSAGIVECGTETKVSRSQTGNRLTVTTRVYSRYRVRRRCRFCGYEYLTSVRTGEVIDEQVETSVVPSRRGNSNSSSSRSKGQYDAEYTCYYYVRPSDAFPGCGLHSGLVYPCQYENCARDCPHFRAK